MQSTLQGRLLKILALETGDNPPIAEQVCRISFVQQLALPVKE